jgi:hypothetical protein
MWGRRYFFNSKFFHLHHQCCSISCYGTSDPFFLCYFLPAFISNVAGLRLSAIHARPKLVCDKDVSFYIRFPRLAPRFFILL